MARGVLGELRHCGCLVFVKTAVSAGDHQPSFNFFCERSKLRSQSLPGHRHLTRAASRLATLRRFAPPSAGDQLQRFGFWLYTSSHFIAHVIGSGHYMPYHMGKFIDILFSSNASASFISFDRKR